jgi:hypothetical protein
MLLKTSFDIVKYNSPEWVNEWVSDCCLTPIQQLFSHIMKYNSNLGGGGEFYLLKGPSIAIMCIYVHL